MTPREAMLLAVREGRRGAGFVSPNPLVGCVILDRDFAFLSSGYHARVGEAHAEIQALNAIAEPARLQGAHIYVTLEPCAHQGRTPSCARHLATLPIGSVTYGLQDPDPRVSGKGADILRDAGKTVTLFTGPEAELQELCEIFLVNKCYHRPFVALKVASSLDGKIALHDGSSQWITGEKSRAHVQFLRGCYDAVAVGVGTFLSDDPRLNSRDPRFADKTSRVVLFDPQGRSFSRLGESQLARVHAPENIFVVSAKQPPGSVGARVLQLPLHDGKFALNEVLAAVQGEGVHSLFVEGGAGTFGGFIEQGLADRLYLFIAPKVLGDGLSWTSRLHVPSLGLAPALEGLRVEEFGGDFLLTGRLSPTFSS